jgi:hypothetical protein
MPKRKGKKRKASTSELLQAARQVDDIAPGLKRLRRRRTLKPWEKAWITRTLNKVNEYGGKSNLIPVQKNQIKKARKNKLTVGGGITAIPKGGFGDGKLALRNGKPVIVEKAGNKTRVWHFERITDPQSIPDRMLELFRQFDAKKKRPIFYLMTTKGRGKTGAGSEYAIENMFGYLRQISDRYSNFNPIVGITWFFN